jgi:heme-degrading monooxygenase HmoA
MFVRIVKMRFQEDKIEAFLENFNQVKEKIRGFEGNQFLELYQDKNDSRIFFTYSYWETEAHLETYRKSALFGEVWSYTKTLFSDKPEAWSVDKVATLK